MKTTKIVIEAESGETLKFLHDRMVETWNWYGRQPTMQGVYEGTLYQIVNGEAVNMETLMEDRRL